MYQTPVEMQVVVDEYINHTPDEELTVTGLALALGFTSRQALMNYQEKAEFVDTVKTAKLRVENAYERSLRKNGRSGDIFGLKNMGWKDESMVRSENKNLNANADISQEEALTKLNELIDSCKQTVEG